LPAMSSTTWTYMWPTLRKIVNRGRVSVPCTRFRIRCLIRSRRSSLVLMRIFDPRGRPEGPPLRVPSLYIVGESGPDPPPPSLRSGLADLLLQPLARVPHALLLVRVGLAHPPDVCGHLPHELSIDARHGDVRLLLDRDIDPGRDVENHRVRIAEREMH